VPINASVWLPPPHFLRFGAQCFLRLCGPPFSLFNPFNLLPLVRKMVHVIRCSPKSPRSKAHVDIHVISLIIDVNDCTGGTPFLSSFSLIFISFRVLCDMNIYFLVSSPSFFFTSALGSLLSEPIYRVLMVQRLFLTPTAFIFFPPARFTPPEMEVAAFPSPF